MIRLTDNIWIGDSHDEKHGDLATLDISGVLNVAHDLQNTRGCNHGVEYMQVGLVDGPGNLPVSYCSAVMALYTLLKRHHHVMVCCHTGGRSMAVVIMYINLMAQRGWNECIAILSERVDNAIPQLHEAHRKAFDGMNWKLLRKLVEG